MRYKATFLFILSTTFTALNVALAQENVVNIYTWSGEIPDKVVHQFEKETGIKVNLSTYENNEVMYAKLRATKQPGYDIIVPSSYFIDRMHKQNMLEPLDKNKLSNWANLNPAFLHPAYDPDLSYSIPYLWGITGIFFNKAYYSANEIQSWGDLWQPRFSNQLMFLDDLRETFGIALLALGYSPNDKDPKHIRAAFLKLKSLQPNIKVFSSDTVVSIMIDEDVQVGAAWNGDAYKASQENNNIHFIFPKEGFVIWVDNLAMPKTAPHKENAYAFINFLLRADIGETVSTITSYPTANLAAQKRLPKEIQNNPIAYPPNDVLKRGQFQIDLGEETLDLYEKYWEELKIGA